MKRSAAVPLTLAATTLSAGALAACGPRQEPMQCVEKTSGRVMPDSVCARAGVTPGSAQTGAAPGAPGVQQQPGVYHGVSPIPALFAWYYGGRIVNGLVSGGSYAPLAGRRYRSTSGFVTSPRPGFGGRPGFGNASPARTGTSRGGFGATGAGRFGGS